MSSPSSQRSHVTLVALLAVILVGAVAVKYTMPNFQIRAAMLAESELQQQQAKDSAKQRDSYLGSTSDLLSLIGQVREADRLLPVLDEETRVNLSLAVNSKLDMTLRSLGYGFVAPGVPEAVEIPNRPGTLKGYRVTFTITGPPSALERLPQVAAEQGLLLTVSQVTLTAPNSADAPSGISVDRTSTMDVLAVVWFSSTAPIATPQ
jgi:hypothetical protein